MKTAAWSAVAVAIALTATLTGQGPKKFTAPKTPWGDPDLQGVWNDATSTPLQRPNGQKDVLTDEELRPLVHVDAVVPGAKLNLGLAAELGRLAATPAHRPPDRVVDLGHRLGDRRHSNDEPAVARARARRRRYRRGGPAHGSAELPESLAWLWRDYDPAKTEQVYAIEESEKSKPLFRVKIANRE